MYVQNTYGYICVSYGGPGLDHFVSIAQKTASILVATEMCRPCTLLRSGRLKRIDYPAQSIPRDLPTSSNQLMAAFRRNVWPECRHESSTIAYGVEHSIVCTAHLPSTACFALIRGDWWSVTLLLFNLDKGTLHSLRFAFVQQVTCVLNEVPQSWRHPTSKSHPPST